MQVESSEHIAVAKTYLAAGSFSGRVACSHLSSRSTGRPARQCCWVALLCRISAFPSMGVKKDPIDGSRLVILASNVCGERFTFLEELLARISSPEEGAKGCKAAFL